MEADYAGKIVNRKFTRLPTRVLVNPVLCETIKSLRHLVRNLNIVNIEDTCTTRLRIDSVSDANAHLLNGPEVHAGITELFHVNFPFPPLL